MSSADLTPEAITKLSKTSATRALAAAVREYQGAPRAANYEQSPPTWWTVNQTVVLADGKSVVCPNFSNPRGLSVPAIKAALNLYIQFKSSLYSNQDDDDANANDTEPDDSVPPEVVEVISENNNETRGKEQETDANQDDALETKDRPEEISDDEVEQVETEEIEKEQKISDGKGKGKDCEQVEAIENSVEEEFIEDDALVKAKALYAARLEHINRLKARRDEIILKSRQVLAAKEARRSKTEEDMKGTLETALLLLSTKYSASLANIPLALQQTTMGDLVDRYGMSKEKWLHVNVARAVERALKDNMTNMTPRGKENQSKRQPQDSGVKRNAHDDVLTPTTPPPRTPAARKRREDIQKTIARTMQRVQREREEEKDGCDSADDDGDVRRKVAFGLPQGERQVGDVLTAMGIDIDLESDKEQMKTKFTRTVKRNPRLLGEIEQWCRELREELSGGDDVAK